MYASSRKKKSEGRYATFWKNEKRLRYSLVECIFKTLLLCSSLMLYERSLFLLQIIINSTIEELMVKQESILFNEKICGFPKVMLKDKYLLIQEWSWKNYTCIGG